jgi:hypothetical protein
MSRVRLPKTHPRMECLSACFVTERRERNGAIRRKTSDRQKDTLAKGTPIYQQTRDVSLVEE